MDGFDDFGPAFGYLVLTAALATAIAYAIGFEIPREWLLGISTISVIVVLVFIVNVIAWRAARKLQTKTE